MPAGGDVGTAVLGHAPETRGTGKAKGMADVVSCRELLGYTLPG